MPNIETLLKPIRAGKCEKIKPLVSKYSPQQLGQALRAAIAHDQAECVEFLVPYVAACEDLDANNMTLIEMAFWTAIVHAQKRDFNCMFKWVDASKNDSAFLYTACQYRRLDMAQRLIPLSDMGAVWKRMEKMNLEEECFDVIRKDYEALEQNKRLNSVVKHKTGSVARKI